jgi:gamma-glutamylcyclotransferase
MHNTSMLYFGYGSNMCTARLRQRVPSANPVRIAKLLNHSLHFHKRSSDGSGKCDACFTGETADRVWGVVYEISQAEKPLLDAHEGLGHGYAEKMTLVIDAKDNKHTVLMYVAENSRIDPALRPYSWYKRFVVEGARQHALPPDYIARIEAVPAAEDPDVNRDAVNRRIF